MVTGHRYDSLRPNKRRPRKAGAMSESIVSVNEESLRLDIKELVKNTVRDVINQLLDEEADELVNAERYERTADREAYRSGHYKRKLVTSSGEVELDVPKLRGATFQTAVIERCRRRETSVEEAIIEMYLAGVSTRRIEDVSQILWGAGVSAGTVSNLNDKAFASVEEWRNRPLEGGYPLRLRRRRVPQAQLGRLLRERVRHGRHRRQRRRRPRGDRLRRGLHRVEGLLEGFPAVAARARALGRPHGHRRQVARHARRPRGGVPAGQVPAMHRLLLPQRVRQGAEEQAREGRQDAQGHTRPGVPRGFHGEGRERRRRPRGDEARRRPKVVREGCAETLTYTAFPP